MEELVFSATFHKGGLVVTDVKYPHRYFRETSVFKMVAEEDGLEEEEDDDLEEEEEEDNLTQEEIWEFEDSLALEESNQYEGWWALPFPPLLAPLPESAYFKLSKVRWPAEFTYNDSSDPGNARDWHPRVRHVSLIEHG